MQTYERLTLTEFLKIVDILSWREVKTKENEILLPIGVPKRDCARGPLVLDHSKQHMLVAGRLGSGYYNFMNNLILLTSFARNAKDPLSIWVIDADNAGLTTSSMLCSNHNSVLACDIPMVWQMLNVTTDMGCSDTIDELYELVHTKQETPVLVVINEADKLVRDSAAGVKVHKILQQALGTNVHFILGSERLSFSKSLMNLSAVRVCLRTSHINSINMLNDPEASTLPTVGYCVSNEYFGQLDSENVLWQVPYLDEESTNILRSEIRKGFKTPDYSLPAVI